jgi:hypothetical protein
MWNFPEIVVEDLVLLNIGEPKFRDAVTAPASRLATRIAQSMHNTWADNPAVVANFGGRIPFEAAINFESTVAKIDELDAFFESTEGAYFHLGDGPKETERNFADTQLKYRRTGVRPSLPGQVAYYLDHLAISRDDPYYRAALLIAARAEVEDPSRPEYHNACHTSDVVAATVEFLKKNNVRAVQGGEGAVKLSRQQIMIGVIAAAAHDIGHPGGKNALPSEKVASDPLRLERQSAAIVEPLLEIAGIPADSIAQIRAAILATSPDANGPKALLNEIDRLHHFGAWIQWEALPDRERFAELRPLAEDAALRVIVQTLRAADLAESCLFGSKANEIATRDLQAEWRNHAYSDVLIGDAIAEDGSTIPNGKTVQARRRLLDSCAYGEAGPIAAGVRAAAGVNYAQLYADTKAESELVKIMIDTHGMLSICLHPVRSRLS